MPKATGGGRLFVNSNFSINIIAVQRGNDSDADTDSDNNIDNSDNNLYG